MGKAGRGGGITHDVANESDTEDVRNTKPILGVTVRTIGEREAVLIIAASIVRKDGTIWELDGMAITAELPIEAFFPMASCDE